MFNTPILFIIFNRTDSAKSVLNKIREIKPKSLYIAADGWREHKIGEKEACLNTRKEIIELIDWECEVKTLFRDNNLGAGKGVYSAINWFFSNVDYGIILEDDCLAELDFFTFCEELLLKYNDNEKVMHISGNNYQFSSPDEYSYYFSRFSETWGWATWKRAWEKYDFYNYKYFSKKVDKNSVSKSTLSYYKQVIYLIKTGAINAWDYQWLFTILLNKGVCIVPQYNLIKNLGFGKGATHTVSLKDPRASLKTYRFQNSLNHPDKVEINENADTWYIKNLSLERESVVSIFMDRCKRNIITFLIFVMKKYGFYSFQRRLRGKSI